MELFFKMCCHILSLVEEKWCQLADEVPSTVSYVPVSLSRSPEDEVEESKVVMEDHPNGHIYEAVEELESK